MKAKTKKVILTALGGLLLLLCYGIVGGMESFTIPEGRGFLEAMACVLGAWWCLSRAGWTRRA